MAKKARGSNGNEAKPAHCNTSMIAEKLYKVLLSKNCVLGPWPHKDTGRVIKCLAEEHLGFVISPEDAETVAKKMLSNGFAKTFTAETVFELKLKDKKSTKERNSSF